MRGSHGSNYHLHPHDNDDGPPPKRPRNSPIADGCGILPTFNVGIPQDRPQQAGGAPQIKTERERQDVAEPALPSITPPSRPQQQEKDKNRKLSCKECRRLKLKCDRVFPCQSCVKRGCGSLCPEGALTSGRGSRFILANTEQLHEKITLLSERVRELEEALESLQLKCSDQPHPLLSPEKLQVKTSQDLYGISQQARPQSQGPPILPPIQSQSHPIAGPSRLPPVDDRSPPSGHNYPASAERHTNNPYPSLLYPPPPEVPPDVLELSAAFPFPWSVDIAVRKRIRDALPPRQEAQAVCEQAQNNALWQYHLDTSETFLHNLLHHCYNAKIEDVRPRRLALLLMLLSIGSIVDLRRSLGSLQGEAYHHLARASLSEIPLMEEPDFDELHTLFFMIWWHLLFSDNKKAVGYAWNLMGIVAKLAQGLGLHRDNPRLKGIPEEYEKRCAIFWELVNLDCRMSLSLGRPPSLSLSHIDTKSPSFFGVGPYFSKEQIAYHEWKNAFVVQCLTPVLEAIVTVDTPSYARFLELDALIRDFKPPSHLDDNHIHLEKSRSVVMQKALVSSSREIVLLQLHRRFFAEAMSSSEPFDLHHKYAPSVIATYQSASSLISTIEALFEHEPQWSARFLYFWFNTYSAAVTLSLLVLRAPLSPFAPNASRDLDRICRLFRSAAQILPASGRILPPVEKLAAKGRACLKQHYTRSHASGDSQHVYHHPAHPQSWFVRGRPSSPSLQHIPPALLKCAEELEASTSRLDLPPSPTTSYYSQSASSNSTDPPWMADIYRYRGRDVTTAVKQSTVFAPSSPRIDGKEVICLDYGSLAGEFGETSYMAWF